MGLRDHSLELLDCLGGQHGNGADLVRPGPVGDGLAVVVVVFSGDFSGARGGGRCGRWEERCGRRRSRRRNLFDLFLTLVPERPGRRGRPCEEGRWDGEGVGGGEREKRSGLSLFFGG